MLHKVLETHFELSGNKYTNCSNSYTFFRRSQRKFVNDKTRRSLTLHLKMNNTMMKLKFCIVSLALSTQFMACDDDENHEVSNNLQNLATVEAFITELENEDPNIFTRLTTDPVVVLKMNPDASQNEVRFVGTEQVQGYLTGIFDLFSQIEFNDIRINSTDDGATVFVQANGNFIVAGADTPYNNVYVLRYDFDELGRIASIEEYLNPVINGEFLGQPLGSCQTVICN